MREGFQRAGFTRYKTVLELGKAVIPYDCGSEEYNEGIIGDGL